MYEIGYYHNGDKIVYCKAETEEIAKSTCKFIQNFTDDEWYYIDLKKPSIKQLSIFDFM